MGYGLLSQGLYRKIMVRKLYTIVLWFQGLYTVITALWALLHIESFMDVTGPKTDTWLVKTVSFILLSIGIGMIAEAISRTLALPLLLLFLLNAIALAGIDFYYATNNVIWNVYLLDGIEQIIFISFLVFFLSRPKHR